MNSFGQDNHDRQDQHADQDSTGADSTGADLTPPLHHDVPSSDPPSLSSEHRPRKNAFSEIDLEPTPLVGNQAQESESSTGRVAPASMMHDSPSSLAAKERPPERRRIGSRLFYFLPTVLLVCCVVWLGPIILENYQYALTRGKVRAEYENADAILREKPLNDVSLAYQLVAQKISPSVVSIKALYRKDRGNMHTIQGGQGSGVILSEDGYIMTNYHVIKDALPAGNPNSTVMVSLRDRSREQATIVGYDTVTDLAILKINKSNLIPAEFGDSDDLRVGSMVWAVGSPYGYENSVTAGIVSGKNRQGKLSDETGSLLQEFIQTDAAVNPGNSGGPLVDARGRVVGINTQIFGEKFQGISFAVPSSDAKFVYEEILEHGEVKRGFLGVYPRLLYRDDQERLNLDELKGVYISTVQPGQPAARSGMRNGDVILTWNGVEVDHDQALFRQIAMTAPGQTVPVEIIRSGQRKSLDVTVGYRSEIAN